MRTLSRFKLPWIYIACFALIFLSGETKGAARFLNNVPQDDFSTDLMDKDFPDYDADVKLPGRHYPKLPYQTPYLENEHETFTPPHHQYNHQTDYHSNYNYEQQHKNHHHQSSYNYQDYNSYGSHQGHHHHQHHQGQVEPVLAYGVRRDPSGTTFSRSKDPYHGGVRDHPADYLDDTGEVKANVLGGHRLGKVNPVTTAPPPPSPSFARDTPRSITVQAGKTAKLICKVLNVGDKSVSWMRHEDLHILTVDKYKYSTDKRLSAIFNEEDQEWILQIQSARPEDTGLYECQVSTKPVLSFIVSMNVVESLPSTTPFPKMRDAEDPALDPMDVREVPSARIVNGPEIYVSRGSPINLSCIVDHTVERPSYIYWYHYNKMIDYDREGDTVKLDKSGPNTISNLLVRNSSPRDSGKYTCRPSNGEDASVMLHVVDGEYPAAMQTNTSDRLMTSLATMLGALSVGISIVILVCRC